MDPQDNTNFASRYLADSISAYSKVLLEMSKNIGELTAGQRSHQQSLDEFKNYIRKKVDEHEEAIKRAQGSIDTWKWIFTATGVLGIGGMLDALFRFAAHFKGQ